MTKYFENAINGKKSVSCTCGWCNNKVGLDIIRQIYHTVRVNKGSTTYPVYSDENYIDYYYGLCPVCTKPLIYDFQTKGTFPPNSEFSMIEFLPDNLNALYEETRNAFSVSAFSACLLLCRKIIMHIAVDLGAKENKNFVDYINFFVEENYINKKTRDWVDKIRSYGNDQNHQIIIGVKDNAENIIKFTEMLMRIIYEFPNKQK